MNNHLYSTHTYCPDYCDCQGLPKFLRIWHDKYCHYSLAAIKLSSNKNKLRLYFLHCHVTKSVPTTVTWQDQTYCPDNCHSLVTRSHLLFWQLSNDKIILSLQLSNDKITFTVLTTVTWQDHTYSPDSCCRWTLVDIHISPRHGHMACHPHTGTPPYSLCHKILSCRLKYNTIIQNIILSQTSSKLKE